MRSRAARFFFGATALIVGGVAAFFLIQSERQISEMRANARVFDVRAREATDALADVRAGQQAYVAAGQGVAFWMPKVAVTLDAAAKTIAELRRTAQGTGARSALDEASRTLDAFVTVDTRARDYLKSG